MSVLLPVLPENPSNSDIRKYAHDIVDYFADIAEKGEVCGIIEDRVLVIYVANNKITFAVGTKSGEWKNT